MLKDGSIKPAFQQRATDLLLIPDLESLPYEAYVDDLRYGNFLIRYEYDGVDWVQTKEQASYAAKRLPFYLEQTKQMHDEITDISDKKTGIGDDSYRIQFKHIIIQFRIL